MKLQPLCYEKLTLDQKLGMTLCAHLNQGEEDILDVLEKIRNHALGAVWVQPEMKNREEILARVRETADYPILILCDAENGVGEDTIPQLISLTTAGAKDEYARSFGRLTAAKLRRMGYNVVCNPLLDICKKNTPCGGSTRTFGPDKKTAARLGVEVARGMHEGGVLTVAKHYPGSTGSPYDSHMRETVGSATAEELEEENLYPYRALIEAGVLDGAMTGHKSFAKIDPEYPASLSKTILSLLRKEGFDGFYITDALCMMGVRLKFGVNDPHGLAIHAGNGLCLSWDIPAERAMEAIREGYNKGLFCEEELEFAVKSVLRAQEKTMSLPEEPPVLWEDRENLRKISEECVVFYSPENLSPTIDPKGRHLFVITTDGACDLDAENDPFTRLSEWYSPVRIKKQLEKLFPNSGVTSLPAYPSSGDVWRFFDLQAGYEDLVFITFYQSESCTGRECLTTRLVDLMDAMQTTDRIIAHVHFGSPFVAPCAPYVPRVLMGLASAKCVENTFRALHGDIIPTGKCPYLLEFHEKGYVFI